MLTIKFNTKQVTRNLNKQMRKKVPAGIVAGLNGTGYDARDTVKGELPRRLDRPTPFTKNAFALQRAKRSTMTATLFAKRIQERYLQWQINGGTATRPKVVPGRTWNLNSYGNLPKGATKQKNVYVSNLRGMYAYWKRRGSKKNRSLQLIGFIPSKRTYRVRFPYYKIAHKVIKTNIDRQMRKHVGRAMKS